MELPGRVSAHCAVGKPGVVFPTPDADRARVPASACPLHPERALDLGDPGDAQRREHAGAAVRPTFLAVLIKIFQDFFQIFKDFSIILKIVLNFFKIFKILPGFSKIISRGKHFLTFS